MEEKTALEILSERVFQMVDRYKTLENENKALKSSLEEANASSIMHQETLKTLTEESSFKDLEIEELSNSIAQSMLDS